MGAKLLYSEAFKLQVVREVESGRYKNCHQASQVYGIHGTLTVTRWVERYGKSHLLNRVVRVETTEERNELKRLKAECRRLKEALADAHLDLRLERAYLTLSCEAAGENNIETFKKKHAGELFITLPGKRS